MISASYNVNCSKNNQKAQRHTQFIAGLILKEYTLYTLDVEQFPKLLPNPETGRRGTFTFSKYDLLNTLRNWRKIRLLILRNSEWSVRPILLYLKNHAVSCLVTIIFILRTHVMFV